MEQVVYWIAVVVLCLGIPFGVFSLGYLLVDSFKAPLRPSPHWDRVDFDFKLQELERQRVALAKREAQRESLLRQL